MITISEYFGTKIHREDATEERKEHARVLLECVNALLTEAEEHGIHIPKDPDTGSQISGAKDGHGDGGFRLSNSTTGKPGSAHKEGMAVDVFDPDNRLDDWITREILIKHGLYREAKIHTPNWTHLQTRPPRSLMRSFNP